MSTTTPVLPEIIHAKLLTESGLKEVKLRFPSDAEWITRQNKRPQKFKVLGRGNSTAVEVDTTPADLELYQAIRLEGSPDLDSYEAESVIEQISLCTAIDVQPEGAGFKVMLQTVAGEVSCFLRIPSKKAVSIYKKTWRRTKDLPFSFYEITVSLSAGKDLFDSCCDEPEKNWPIVWKAVSAASLLEAIESITASDSDINFH
jgi:hypothetical protein